MRLGLINYIYRFYSFLFNNAFYIRLFLCTFYQNVLNRLQIYSFIRHIGYRYM